MEPSKLILLSDVVLAGTDIAKSHCQSPMAAHIPDASSSGIDLDVLFRRYAGELQQHAFRRLKDREAAADVVQDSFVRLLLWRRGRSQVSFPYGSRSFLWKIVGNLTVDVIRRNRIIGSVGSLDDALEAIDPNPTPIDILKRESSMEF